MERYQQQAWDCLTKREQDSLFLNISQGLSTRKTGEVLKMSHYKYLAPITYTTRSSNYRAFQGLPIWVYT